MCSTYRFCTMTALGPNVPFLAPCRGSLRSILVGTRALSVTTATAATRPHVRRPQHPFWERKKMLAVSKPSYPEPHPDTTHLWRDCPRTGELLDKEEKKVANAFERLYAEEMRHLLVRSDVVVLFHFNELTHYPRLYAWQNCRRAGIELKWYNHRVARAAVSGTRWENLLHFWENGTEHIDGAIGFGGTRVRGKEVSVASVLKLDRKIPEGFILGAIVQDRFLNKKQLQDLSAMPSIDAVRADLCAVLQVPAQKTTGLLGHNQQVLSQSLQQYLKDQEEAEKNK